MDVRLQGEMDGVEASREIVRYQSIPIVYLTAYSSTFFLVPSAMVHPYLCIAKPFSEHGVQAAIESALGISSRAN